MRILIWGTGKIATQTINELKNIVILGFIETEKTFNQYCGHKVYSVEEIPNEFDMLLIANRFSDTIYSICKEKKIDLAKVCFMRKGSFSIDIEHNLELARQIMNDLLYQKVCLEFEHIADDWVHRDAEKYSLMNTRTSFAINEYHNFYKYDDKYTEAGSIGSYFWQDLWAARKVFQNNPDKHYDIGSRIDGFISHLLTFRKNVFVLDIRPLDRNADGLMFLQADATNLNEFRDNSIESLSALCSLEHFGLGRYGDKIEPEACFKCFDAIGKKVKPGGYIYISVPVGYEHIEFNAHRVFFASTIVDAFHECDLVEYSCTYDGYIEYDIDIHKYDDDKSLGGARHGLFQFRKKYLS